MGRREQSLTRWGMCFLNTKGEVRSTCCLTEGTTGSSGTRRSRRMIVVDFGIGSVSELTTIGSHPITRRPLHIDRLFVMRGCDSTYACSQIIELGTCWLSLKWISSHVHLCSNSS